MRKLPSLRRHKPTSQAVVTLSGKDHYLGVWPPDRKTAPPETQAKYKRLIAEWLAGNRHPRADPAASPVPPDSQVPNASPSSEPFTVAELLAAYWQHAETYYRRPDGGPSPELICLRSAPAPLRTLYDDLPAADFSPLKLNAVREAMIGARLMRGTINRNVGRIKRVFAWGVENKLIPRLSPTAFPRWTG